MWNCAVAVTVAEIPSCLYLSQSPQHESNHGSQSRAHHLSLPVHTQALSSSAIKTFFHALHFTWSSLFLFIFLSLRFSLRIGCPRTSTNRGTIDVVLVYIVPCVWRVLGHTVFHLKCFIFIFSKNTDSHRDSGVQQYLLAFTNATVMDVGVFTVAWAEREFSPVHYPFTNPISTELL